MAKSYSMKVKFESAVLHPLFQALSNEHIRWENACFADGASTLTKNNYERDMVYLNNLILGFEWCFNEGKDVELLLNSRDIGYIVEALENEMILLNEPSPSNFDLENWSLINNLRDQIKNQAIDNFGKNFLDSIHYDRSKK